MKAYVFPGQGAQFPGMGKELYDSSDVAKELFQQADDLLGYALSEIMFNGPVEELKKTQFTQPAIFLHSVVLSKVGADHFQPDAVAGHSLGEFSALVANQALTFEDGLRLVQERALAMQDACDIEPSTMAAVLGMEDERVKDICDELEEVVVAANFNCPGQVVISGSIEGVSKACEVLKEAGARRALILNVAGAFHSPLMKPAKERLEAAIDAVDIHTPTCPIYQNVNAKPTVDTDVIKENLVQQLTAPVLWTQTVQTMINAGVTQFIEVGPGNVLQGLVKKVSREVETVSFTNQLSA